MEAREMQIEFERLVQLADPKFEYSDKIDSDTIFYFINAAQERYVKDSMSELDKLQKGSNTYNRLLDTYKALVTNTVLVNKLNNDNYSNAVYFELPNETNNKFFVYLTSYCNITNTNSDTVKIANNELISATDITKILTTNSNKPILRKLPVILSGNTNKSTITVFYDIYTNVISCAVTYIRKPLDINVIQTENTTSVCELDSNVHREIVQLAVDMFIREGAFRLTAKSNSGSKQDNNE